MPECFSCRLGPCEKSKERCDGLQEDLGNLVGGQTQDWYPESTQRDGLISIEVAAREEHRNKGLIDDAVEAENVYSSSSGKIANVGKPVCKWRKGSQHG